MARTATKQVPKKSYQCETCGNAFVGVKKCPTCGETTAVLELTTDGIPITDVQSIVGPQPRIPIVIGGDTDLIDPEEELKRMVRNEHQQIVSDTMLDKARTRAADEEARRIRAQQELELTKQGFIETKKPFSMKDTVSDAQDSLPAPINVAPGMLIRELGGWSQEDREEFLEKLADNPQMALGLSMIANPQKQQPYNPMMGQMMNPMMGMQQPVQQAPAPSAAEMMTSMVAVLQKMQEMSHANQPKESGMDRVMDKLEKMEERNKDLELKLAEMGNQSQPIDMEAVRNMVRDAQENARAGQDDMLGKFNEIGGFISQMEDLGLVRSRGSSDEESFKERQWRAEFGLKEKQMDREDKREKLISQEAVAKQATTAKVFETIMNMSQAAEYVDAGDDEPKEEKKHIASVIT